VGLHGQVYASEELEEEYNDKDDSDDSDVPKKRTRPANSALQAFLVKRCLKDYHRLHLWSLPFCFQYLEIFTPRLLRKISKQNLLYIYIYISNEVSEGQEYILKEDQKDQKDITDILVRGNISDKEYERSILDKDLFTEEEFLKSAAHEKFVVH